MGPFLLFCGVSSCEYILDIPAWDKQELCLATGRNCVGLHRSLNAIVAQSKNCPFGVNTRTELQSTYTTTSANNGV